MFEIGTSCAVVEVNLDGPFPALLNRFVDHGKNFLNNAIIPYARSGK